MEPPNFPHGFHSQQWPVGWSAGPIGTSGLVPQYGGMFPQPPPPALGQLMGPFSNVAQDTLITESGDRPRILYGDIALPLGSQLALSVKEKIRRREYVDIFSLLQMKLEPVPKLGDPI